MKDTLASYKGIEGKASLDPMDRFAARLVAVLGQKDAEIICRDNQWFGVLARLAK